MLSLKGAGPRTRILVGESTVFYASPYTWGWCLFPRLAGGYLFGVEGRKKGCPCCSFNSCVSVILFYFLVIFIGVELLYSIVLVSAVQQRESARHAHLSWLFFKTVVYFFSWASCGILSWIFTIVFLSFHSTDCWGQRIKSRSSFIIIQFSDIPD